MNYLLHNNERYALRLLAERPEELKRINPWWFFDDIAKHIAWGIYKAERDYKEWSLDNIHDILEDRNIDKNMIDRYLDIHLPDPKILDDVINYFVLTSQIFEIAEKEIEKSVLSKKEVEALRAISESLKEGKWSDKVIDVVAKLYVKVTDDRKTKADMIKRRRQQLSKRFE